jgi:hypothetical protein
MQLWHRLMQPQKYAPPGTIGLVHLAKTLSQSFFKPDFYMPYLAHNRRHRSNLSRLAKNDGVDVLFFSRQEDHTDRLGGRYYNRHIDPITELVKTHYTYLKLELQTEKTALTLPRFEYTHFFDTLDYLKCDAQRSLIAAFQKNAGGYPLEQGATLTDLLARTRFDLALTEEYLMLEAERMLHYIRYFKELLAALGPKAVFLNRYYDEFGMALIAASREMGIATVDIQADVQGPYHAMYGQWPHVPKGGYSMLPDYLWCWGQPAVDALLGKGGLVEGAPRPVLGGHRWLAKWIEHDAGAFHIERETRQYVSELDRHERVVLVSLQSDIAGVPDALLEAMQKAPLDWFWLLRLPPENQDKIDEMEVLLRQLRIKNADVGMATRLPLYLLLKHTDRHIAGWSSTSYEALRFGVPSLLIHPATRVVCASYLQKGFFETAETAEEMIDRLTRPVQFPEETQHYATTYRAYALDALQENIAPTGQAVHAV